MHAKFWHQHRDQWHLVRVAVTSYLSSALSHLIESHLIPSTSQWMDWPMKANDWNELPSRSYICNGSPVASLTSFASPHTVLSFTPLQFLRLINDQRMCQSCFCLHNFIEAAFSAWHTPPKSSALLSPWPQALSSVRPSLVTLLVIRFTTTKTTHSCFLIYFAHIMYLSTCNIVYISLPQILYTLSPSAPRDQRS